MTLEDEFNRAMEEVYYRAGREAGYWANYFIRDLRQKGGLATAKSLLRPRAGPTLHAARILRRRCAAGARERLRADPTAREACLKRHGYRCAVCGMSFEERY